MSRLPPTNRYGLPAPIVAAVSRFSSKYDSGDSDITATQLGESPRIVALKQRHGEEIQEDVSDLLYVLDGHIVHEILENAAAATPMDSEPIFGGDPLAPIVIGMRATRFIDNIVEHRFFSEFRGWKVSGQVDLYTPDTAILSDYKRVAVAQRKRGIKDEWVWQLNVLAELMRRNGLEPKELEAVRWYRDWSLSAKNRETDYPLCAVERVPIPMWSSEKATAWIEERVEIHQLAKMVADDAELPPCSLSERYNPGPTWAVMKKNAARASRVLPTEAEAAMWLSAQADSKNLSIVERPGEDKRCLLYCNVNTFCSYWKERYGNPQERETEEIALEGSV